MNTLRKTAGVLILFCTLLCACSISNAQDYYGGNSWRKKPANNPPPPKDLRETAEPSGYTSINFGWANPVGSFASSFGSGYGGYAIPGLGYNFSFAVPISHSNFGLAFMFGSYNNQYDLNNYINYLNNSSPNYAYGSLNIAVNNVYSENSILGGLYVTYPIGRLSIDGRVMLGALLNGLPEQAYGQEDAAGDIWEYDLQPSYPTSFAVDAGVGLRFLVAKIGRRQLCVMANVDYLYSEVSYNATQYEVTQAFNSSNVYQFSNNLIGRLPISLMNITFGIGYQFGGGE